VDHVTGRQRYLADWPSIRLPMCNNSRKTVEARLPRQAQDSVNWNRSKTEPFSSFENGQGFCVCDLCGGSLRGESRKNALPLRNNREEARRRRGFHNKMFQFYQAKLRTAVGTPRDVVFCWDIILYAQVPPADDTTLSGSKLHELRRGKKKRHFSSTFRGKRSFYQDRLGTNIMKTPHIFPLLQDATSK
jgi:hypothetical protein